MVSFLFVDSERVWRGGQDQLFTLLRGLILRGHRVSLICHPRTLLENRAREAGAVVYPVPFRRRNALISLFRCWTILRRLKPDILAFNTPHPILICNLASRFSTVRARIIFRRVNFPLRKNLITRLKYSWGIDCIVAISESIGSQLKAGGVPASRIRTIYEGIDLNLYAENRSARSRPPGQIKVVGTLAYLSREKGVYFLVEAAAMIPEVQSKMRFVIVGDGECRRELEAQVRKRGLENCFEFAGFQDAPAKYLDRFDIFVLPSLSEGLSSSILSAMASSLPVVATEVGGIPELIHHGQNGLLVPPGNAAALAAALQDLVDHPQKAASMGRMGRELLRERFTLERKILETERLCLSLLQGSTPASETVDAKSV
jgi:glycosyltransferase involved in cell wall biosynthesis